ncbi:MAG: DsrE family protein [Burkholderiaceae bacterium]|jgi:intracellular sulfur oxidation DsrE/DsrF family protein
MIKQSVYAVMLGLACTTLAAVSAPQTARAQAAAGEARQGMKVVYHINDSDDQALAALRNMRNHLDVAPSTEIVAVAHADGIDFLSTKYDDAKTVGPLIAGLAARGVRFEVCEITIGRKQWSKDDFVLEAEFTPSGVARITELQIGQGYAYIKP